MYGQDDVFLSTLAGEHVHGRQSNDNDALQWYYYRKLLLCSKSADHLTFQSLIKQCCVVTNTENSTARESMLPNGGNSTQTVSVHLLCHSP